MKKLVGSYAEILWPVLLYLDDLAEILEILQEIDNDVEISSSGYQFNNLDELAGLKSEVLNELTIRRTSPYVSLKLEPSSVYLYIAEDTTISRGLYEKIKAVLNTRRRMFAPGLSPGSLIATMLYSVTSLGLFTLGSITIVDGLKSNVEVTTLAIGFLALLLGGLWLWQTFFSMLCRYSIIILKYKVDAPSFLKRNLDKIILVIVGVLAKYLFDLLVAGK